MAPSKKKPRTTASSKVPEKIGARANQRNAPSAPIDDDEFQTHTFVSPQAAKDFQDRAKSIIRERELLLDEERNPEIFDNVMKRGWQSFIEDPGEANVSMVREFFANAAHSDNNTSVKVRDVVVRFDPAHINNYFNLPDLSLEGYNTVKKKTIFDDLIRTLCPRGTSWKGEKKSFNRSELSKEAKAWAYFVSARLLPTSAVSTVLPPRLLLIYAIIIGIDINWAGVPTRENDETMKPQLPIKDVWEAMTTKEMPRMLQLHDELLNRAKKESNQFKRLAMGTESGRRQSKHT
ncbi:PREDICTED: uncharacterized protein LOC105962958 [Erythranthe guttata]|uniref:uncharacterized protein LOC105962958 n=1 Tax=Erythranthe guttata TaxID=4155 RepID=UPI00064D8043|nr:PREDICTED: uncharacterized protein LOC105962958 [Erythranthe guttata]|eukprot:XP_012842756.1 PREDICTED: uncharacterized protein LOC105962958 [Erythranthe guttata]